MSKEALVFDLNPAMIPVTLVKKGSKEEWKCELREMSGEDRDKFMNENRKKIDRASKDVKDFADIQVILISKTLWDVSDPEKDKLVPKEEIRHFPAKVQHELYTKAIELNGLGADAEDDEKND